MAMHCQVNLGFHQRIRRRISNDQEQEIGFSHNPIMPSVTKSSIQNGFTQNDLHADLNSPALKCTNQSYSYVDALTPFINSS